MRRCGRHEDFCSIEVNFEDCKDLEHFNSGIIPINAFPMPISYLMHPYPHYCPKTQKRPHIQPKLLSSSSRIPHPPPRNHTSNNNHPHQKHRPHNPKREHGQPTLTRRVLLQPGQRLHVHPGIFSVIDVQIAVTVDIPRGPEELDRGFDEAGEIEDEEDEGGDGYYAGDEVALVDEEEHCYDEEDCEGADGYAVGHYPVETHISIHPSYPHLQVIGIYVPRYPQPQLPLRDHKARENPYEHSSRCEHDEHPEV